MDKISLVTMYVGESGSGKTYNLCTHPKVGIISTEPNHHLVWLMNPHLRKNVVVQKYFIPSSENFKGLFIEIDKQIQLYKEMYEKGEVETLGIDNLTYLIHNRWLWMNKFQQLLTKSGEVDTRGMYGQLRTWCYEFILMKVMTFKGNIVVNLHLMIENDEALEKKTDKTMDKVPNLLGGFRNDINGMFSNVFYLDKKLQPDGKSYKYLARTNKGNGKNAKNRLNLPTIIENVSYQSIMQAVNKAMEEVKE